MHAIQGRLQLICLPAILLAVMTAVWAADEEDSNASGVIDMTSTPTAAQTPESSENEGAGQKEVEKAEQSADKVVQQMLDLRRKGPTIAPTQRPADEAEPGSPLVPLATVDIDPKVIGAAPGQAEPMLRREGEFIVNRSGRLVRSSKSSHLLFVFDTESARVSEPPMVLLPCQLLQNMEDLIQERGADLKFILSGQVLLYRGVNYLLPTMMKLSIDRGNLEN